MGWDHTNTPQLLLSCFRSNVQWQLRSEYSALLTGFCYATWHFRVRQICCPKVKKSGSVEALLHQWTVISEARAEYTEFHQAKRKIQTAEAKAEQVWFAKQCATEQKVWPMGPHWLPVYSWASKLVLSIIAFEEGAWWPSCPHPLLFE